MLKCQKKLQLYYVLCKILAKKAEVCTLGHVLTYNYSFQNTHFVIILNIFLFTII